MIPKNSVKTDWEVELAVAGIGRKAYVSEAEALNHVAGYMLHNDYSERAFQLERSGQWGERAAIALPGWSLAGNAG